MQFRDISLAVILFKLNLLKPLKILFEILNKGASKKKCCIRRKFHFTFDVYPSHHPIDSIFIVHTVSERARRVRHALELENACDFSSIYDLCMHKHTSREHSRRCLRISLFLSICRSEYFHNIYFASSLMFRRRRKKIRQNTFSDDALLAVN